MHRNLFAAALAVFFFCGAANAQRAEVMLSLNEPFFDTLLDAVYQNFEPQKFSLKDDAAVGECDESITILREKGRVRTAVRFRGGAIAMPIAFTGRYDLPLVGCVDFSGTADATANIEFDPENQRLLARANVTGVSLAGTGGVGKSVVARLVRGTIDKKLNPIEIIKLDKMSFAFPVRDAGNLKMKAVAARAEAINSALNVFVTYEFSKE